MTLSVPPRATYRLQLSREFTFANAVEIVPYLHALGFSHLYTSPVLKARSGSPHGYDIVDHNAINPEIGDQESFRALVETLHAHDMGVIVDVVPNHVGVGGDENNWWLDVLENGPSSRYADYFDIDWHPVKQELRNKVLLPVLDDHYGSVLENGALRLELDVERGELSVRFHEHRFPLDPMTYSQVFNHHENKLSQTMADADNGAALQQLIRLCEGLPLRSDLTPKSRERRVTEVELCKRQLRKLCHTASVCEALSTQIQSINGVPGCAKSFDALHALLEAQAYRLAYWKVAGDDINYRRFFDVNDLAGIRMENPEVFRATHRFVAQLASDNAIDGLRIDHPDGLADPRRYFANLQQLLGEAAHGAVADEQRAAYVVVEKILASYEQLPEDWPVHGTTGYDFARIANGLLVQPAAAADIERIYARFIGTRIDFDELLYDAKKLIIKTQLSSELTVLANLLDRVAESDRYTRDFTLNGLRDALSEVAASFPVYRTYTTSDQVSETDRRYVEWALATVKKRSPASDVLIFDFIRDALLLENRERWSSDVRSRIDTFIRRFQQYTAPVMAKATEDTAFYIYNLLLSLNEVGSDPREFGVSPAAFHHANQERRDRWPHAMITTSTHDSKRSEDVRARINVLSEIPEQWRRHLGRWARINAARKRIVDGDRAPYRNDEYHLYQTLVGAWPLGVVDESGLTAFRKRIEAYMLKAAREAKTHTSWLNPNEEYEGAITDFVGRLLAKLENNAFLADFVPFQQRVARFGLLNSLSQTVLKLTAPGIPDVYQGYEVARFDLVDPDNRRPVDFANLGATLRALTGASTARGKHELARDLVDELETGRAKMYLIWQALAFRRQHAALFANGAYLPLDVHGSKADHVVAFARRLDEACLIVAAPRWYARLLGDEAALPLGRDLWKDTHIEIPLDQGFAPRYKSILTGRELTVANRDGSSCLEAAHLFEDFPVALISQV